MDIRSSLSALPFAVVYGGMAALSLLGSRFEGGVAFVWISTALLIARLVALPVSKWWPYAASCFATGIVATGFLGFGWPFAPLMGVANIGEAVLAAALLSRIKSGDEPYDTLQWLYQFFLFAGVLAPLTSGIVGPAAVNWLQGKDIASIYLEWSIGHGLGNIAFTPLFSFVMTREWRRFAEDRSPRNKIEIAGVSVAVIAVSIGTFSQNSFPLLFMPVLAITIATFRLGRVGATVSIALLIVISGAMTSTGFGPVHLIAGTFGLKVQFLQFYLAATVLTVLPVAIEVSRKNALHRALRESEVRYRVLADTSTDIIMNVDIGGVIRFVSSSIRQLGGYEPEELIGMNAGQLIAPEYQEAVALAHGRTLAMPNSFVAVEYEALTRTGERRWFETNARAILTEEGSVEGTVSIIRDISNRKATEARLSKDAHTDALTGLPNRRAFGEQMAALISARQPACVAIFDLDHFKAINDKFGHAGGDAVLANFAVIAATVLRTSDMVARIGGEEFAVLLPDATRDQARLICERLIRTISENTTHFEDAAIRCTASCGLATLGENAERSLQAADLALYQAKQRGRDQVMMAAA